MNILDYSKGVEKLVDPMMVGQSHYMQTKLRKAVEAVDFDKIKTLAN